MLTRLVTFFRWKTLNKQKVHYIVNNVLFYWCTPTNIDVEQYKHERECPHRLLLYYGKHHMFIRFATVID